MAFAPPASPALSVCVIVRDEAARLPGCLASLRGLEAEVVVVDTGSTDATIAVACAAGARVHTIAWPGDFAAARNVALGHATGRWVLALDADEHLPEASVAAVRELVAWPAERAYELVQRSALPGGHRLDVAIVRLFPRDARVRFERPIHEQVNTSLERAGISIEATTIIIEHDGYLDPTAMPAKTRRNRKLIEATLAREPDGDPHLRYFYAATLLDGGESLAAAREYLACAEACGSDRPRLAAAARLKAAEAFHQAGDAAEALDCLPVKPGPNLHPLAAWLCGEIAAGAGWTGEAIRWLEALLAVPDRAYLPPVAVGPLRLKALALLADLWARQHRMDVAVQVLQLGLGLGQGRVPADPVEITRRYLECRRVVVRAA